MNLTISAPPSKSMSHRAAIAASLAKGQSELTNFLSSQDTDRTLSCLEHLGAEVDKQQEILSIQGIDFEHYHRSQEPLYLDVGESGTTCRLLTPIAALGYRPCRVFGQGRMHQRPIGELTSVLESLGTSFHWEEAIGYPPFMIYPQGLDGGQVKISLEESSQFLSGILLAAPLARQETTITVVGEKALSWPYVALTLQTMQTFSVQVFCQTLSQNQSWETIDWTEMESIIPGKTRFLIQPGAYQARHFQVEGDWSNASYFVAAGLFLPQGLALKGLNQDSQQGDRKIVDILAKMGARLKWESSNLKIYPGSIRGTELDMGSCPDLVPTVAVLASMAESPTRIGNVAHLRLKESNRLEALSQEIVKTGCRVELLADGLYLEPQSFSSGQEIDFLTYGDHRIAMSLSLYELQGIDVRLDRPGCVQKSFPDFWQRWQQVRQASK